MTIRDKVSMFFEALLNEIEEIDSDDIKAYALQGLLTQVQYHIQEVKQLASDNKVILKENVDE